MGAFVQSLAFGVVLASAIAIGAMGFTIQFDLTNVLNLSFGSIMTVAAFGAYLLEEQHLNVWLCLVLGSCVASLVTLIIGRTVFRAYARRKVGLFEMVMATLGLGLVLEYAVYAISQDQIYEFSFPQGATLKFGVVHVTVTQLIILGVGIVAFLALEGLLRLTRLGKALRAMAADPSLARACGISTGRIVVVTWLVSGFLCGAAGVVYAVDTLTVSYGMGPLFLPLVLAAAMLGGVGSPVGAVLASLAMGLVTEIVSLYGGTAYSVVAAFGVLVVVLLSRPTAVLAASANRTDITV